MNCDYSNTTTTITSPIGYDTWLGGTEYTITWDSSLPVFSRPDYSRGVDLEIIKNNRRTNTFKWVHTYHNINISQPYLIVDVNETTWNVTYYDHTDYLYRLTMIPLNLKEGETDVRNGSLVHCINPIPIHVVPANWSPNPEDPNSGGSKNRLSSFYYVAIAVFSALALVAH